MKKFRNLEIYYDYGCVSREIISNFEKNFNIKLPDLYIQLITIYNAPGVNQNYFDYYDSYHDEDEGASFCFEGFETDSNIDSPPENILGQYLYDDPIYGYENVYSFGSTARGDYVCFDYRDNPLGDNPKICIVIHDEYDEKTGRKLLFPVADNFEEFLDKLYDFNERYPEE
ncbi:SMI1/KNR4 family protein [Muribacter muris]|nr:SMI1/KNR4 family protein [Muribacter muris]